MPSLPLPSQIVIIVCNLVEIFVTGLPYCCQLCRWMDDTCCYAVYICDGACGCSQCVLRMLILTCRHWNWSKSRRLNAVVSLDRELSELSMKWDSPFIHNSWPHCLSHGSVLYKWLHITSQEIGWEERLRNDRLCVKWDVKLLTQLISLWKLLNKLWSWSLRLLRFSNTQVLKSTPCSRQITTPATPVSFYRQDALPAAQPATSNRRH